MSARRRGGVLGAVAALLLGLQLLAAGPSSAHAELIGSTPSQGQRLESAPAQVRLEFTENVNLIDGGIRLLDGDGKDVPVAAASSAGHDVTVPMPRILPDDSYVLSWRVVSSDGHPVAGAVAFGVGTAAGTVSAPTLAPTAAWPVVIARYGGYLGVALLLGVIAFVVVCAPQTRENPALQRLLRAGLVLGAVSTVAGLVVQGPYVAGGSWSRIAEPGLLAGTLGTSFGMWMLARLVVYVGLAAMAWQLSWLDTPVNRAITAVLAVVASITFPFTGHGASSGRLTDAVVDNFHVLAAGVWVGGLVVLVVLGRGIGAPALLRFSRLAMASVLVLVVSGTINSLIHLDHLDQLWDTRYGQLLVAKLALVAVALAAADTSRVRVRQGGSPLGSVRLEAATTVVVLAVTAALTMTTPPPTGQPAPTATAAVDLDPTIVMDLGAGRVAQLHLIDATTAGTGVHLDLVDDQGRPMASRRAELRATLPARNLGPIPVPLTQVDDAWIGDVSFPLPGTWKLVLTVEDRARDAVVTSGTVKIGNPPAGGVPGLPGVGHDH